VADQPARPLDALLGARVYDLAHPLEQTTPVSPNHPPFRMALMRRHGDSTRPDGSSGANELMTLGGHTGTHIDALCHVSLNGRLYDGHDAAAAAVGGRFGVLGVERIEPALLPGVLLDVPRALGLDQLPAAHPITAEELELTCAAHGVQVRAGMAVLIRTGWPVGRFGDPASFAGWVTGVPGPDVSAARWLVERGVALTGADTIAYEHLPAGAGHRLLPVHVLLLVEHGVHIVEVLDLEALAAAGEREFVLVVAPLKITGATGSPLRPLALVA
jgi:kynurenine formamidase